MEFQVENLNSRHLKSSADVKHNGIRCWGQCLGALGMGVSLRKQNNCVFGL